MPGISAMTHADLAPTGGRIPALDPQSRVVQGAKME